MKSAVGAIAAFLEVGWQEAAQLCCSTPTLLNNDSAKLAKTASWLKEHLSLTSADLRHLLVSSFYICYCPPVQLASSAAIHLQKCMMLRQAPVAARPLPFDLFDACLIVIIEHIIDSMSIPGTTGLME